VENRESERSAVSESTEEISNKPQCMHRSSLRLLDAGRQVYNPDSRRAEISEEELIEKQAETRPISTDLHASRSYHALVQIKHRSVKTWCNGLTTTYQEYQHSDQQFICVY